MGAHRTKVDISHLKGLTKILPCADLEAAARGAATALRPTKLLCGPAGQRAGGRWCHEQRYATPSGSARAARADEGRRAAEVLHS